jgi:chlorite dismutase
MAIDTTIGRFFCRKVDALDGMPALRAYSDLVIFSHSTATEDWPEMSAIINASAREAFDPALRYLSTRQVQSQYDVSQPGLPPG